MSKSTKQPSRSQSSTSTTSSRRPSPIAPKPDVDVIYHRVPIDTLHEDPANARRHGKDNLADIRASLLEFGQVEALVVQRSSRKVIGGNGRLGVMRELLKAGRKEFSHVDIADLEISDVKAASLGIALNRAGERAKWDKKALEAIMREIQTSEAELAQAFDDLATELGITVGDLPAGKTDPDDAPPVPDDPTTKPGDVWHLGSHRLLCGDATNAAAIDAFLQGITIKMMFTDPPWNVAIGQDSNPRHRQRPGLTNDDLSPEKFLEFLKGFSKVAAQHVSGDTYCVLGTREWPTIDTAMREAGFHWSGTLVWVKDSFVLGRSKYHRRFEPIWYGWHQSGRSTFRGRRDLDDVWEVTRPKRSEQHPTMKPVELVVKAIENSSTPGDAVLDLFGGAGSTMIAAEQLRRKSYLVEIDPGYCDVIVKRWEDFTGYTAERFPAAEHNGAHRRKK